MNTVAFETALALKDAGFPQPEFEVGQNWYDVDGTLFWVKCLETPYIHGEWHNDDHHGFAEIPHGDEVFAPTATDILRKIYAPGNGLVLNPLDLLNMVINVEAAAKAFLELKKETI